MKNLKLVVAVIFLLSGVALAKSPHEVVWIIRGSSASGFHCDSSGCIGVDGFWTGTNKVYSKYMKAGWSPNWKDAKQYKLGGPDPNFEVPNGSHCCYAEYPERIDPKTGKEPRP